MHRDAILFGLVGEKKSIDFKALLSSRVENHPYAGKSKIPVF